MVDDKPLPLPGLKIRLKALHQQNEDALVVIQADQDSNHGRVVQVMDAAQKLGLKRLAIATAIVAEDAENEVHE